MKENGFTLVELLSVIVILAIISGIGVISFNALTNKSENDYFVNLENNLQLAASRYFKDHRTQRPNLNEICSKVSLANLIDNNYIETVTDQNGEVCNLSNSYVYIKRNASNQYEYKLSLQCDSYNQLVNEGSYCVLEDDLSTINLSATTSKGIYNALLTYDNTPWTNEDVKVDFSSSNEVSKYVILNKDTNEEISCIAINGNCSHTFSQIGNYRVESFNGETLVGSLNFNIKIDKTAPTFSLENTNDVNIPTGASVTQYTNKIVNIIDESGIKETNFVIYKNDSLYANNSVSTTSISVSNLTSGRYRIEVKVYDRASNESGVVIENFNVTRNIRLIDSLDSSYDYVYQVVDGTNYDYLGTSLPFLNKSGYNFLGWYTTSTGGSRITDISTVDTSTVVLYARWE